MEPKQQTIKTRCCIAGGGPAGIMLGYLLARAGIDVVVLEKWGDFLRDFRGDTIHPSTMEVLNELGLLEAFLALKPNETPKMTAFAGDKKIELADFTHLKVKCPFIAFIPQSDFLNFLSKEGKKYSNFRLLMNTEALDVIEDGNTVRGIIAKSEQGNIRIEAELTVGADGRHSTIRKKAGLEVTDFDAPIDVLWFRVSRNVDENRSSSFYVGKGKIGIILERGTYWQCGFLIKKDGFEDMKKQGIDGFRNIVASLVPPIADKVSEIKEWDSVKLLSVSVNYLKKWFKPGLICIGDAAHAMSPIGGVGINLAIQDAVATANILIPAFMKGTPSVLHLLAIQERRTRPALIIQKIQVFIHKNVMMRVLNAPGELKVPFLFNLIGKISFLKRIPGRLIGMGLKPEHIELKHN